MSLEEDVLRIGKKLDKIIAGKTTHSDPLDLLTALKEMPMNLETLQKTRIGMAVNSLRKSPTCSEVVANLCKQLIKNWKKLLDTNSTKSPNGKVQQNGMPPVDSAAEDSSAVQSLSRDGSVCSNVSDSLQPMQSQDSNDSTGLTDAGSLDSAPSTLSGASNSKPTTTKQLCFPSVPRTDDEVRLKCREMIFNSLKMEDMPDGTQDPEELANRIEAAIFEVHKGTGDKYKACIRSRVFNLRDKKNPELRVSVLVGMIPPKRLAVMSAEEMASSEMKNEREKFTKEAINEHQMAETAGTPTDMFKCGKCKGYKCTYTQLQTRSADEPMTTFVYCTACGNRWKDDCSLWWAQLRRKASYRCCFRGVEEKAWFWSLRNCIVCALLDGIESFKFSVGRQEIRLFETREMINLQLDGLTEAERQHIISVLRRDLQLQETHKQGLVKLKHEIHVGTAVADLRTPPSSSRTCERCCKELGVLFRTGAVCAKCSKRICDECTETVDEQRSVCSVCHKEWQYMLASGEWFYKGRSQQQSQAAGASNQQPRFSDAHISDEYRPRLKTRSGSVAQQQQAAAPVSELVLSELQRAAACSWKPVNTLGNPLVVEGSVKKKKGASIKRQRSTKAYGHLMNAMHAMKPRSSATTGRNSAQYISTSDDENDSQQSDAVGLPDRSCSISSQPRIVTNPPSPVLGRATPTQRDSLSSARSSAVNTSKEAYASATGAKQQQKKRGSNFSLSMKESVSDRSSSEFDAGELDLKLNRRKKAGTFKLPLASVAGEHLSRRPSSRDRGEKTTAMVNGKLPSGSSVASCEPSRPKSVNCLARTALPDAEPPISPLPAVYANILQPTGGHHVITTTGAGSARYLANTSVAGDCSKRLLPNNSSPCMSVRSGATGTSQSSGDSLSLKIPASRRHTHSPQFSRNPSSTYSRGYYAGVDTSSQYSGSQQSSGVVKSSSYVSLNSGVDNEEDEEYMREVSGEILLQLTYNIHQAALEVHVIKCQNLASQSKTAPNAYVKTYLLPDTSAQGKRKTKFKRNNAYPKFDQVLKYMGVTRSELETRVLLVSVWHHDLLGKNLHIGEVRVPLCDYPWLQLEPVLYALTPKDQSSPTSVDLEQRFNVATNLHPLEPKIAFSVKFVPNENGNVNHRSMLSGVGSGQLFCLVRSCQSLIMLKPIGTMNSFAKATLYPVSKLMAKQKTGIVKRSTDPSFNHMFVFNDISLENIANRSLELSLWNSETFGANQLLGGVRLNLGTGLCENRRVEWMDANEQEVKVWRSIIERPSMWIEATLCLRSMKIK